MNKKEMQFDQTLDMVTETIRTMKISDAI